MENSLGVMDQQLRIQKVIDAGLGVNPQVGHTYEERGPMKAIRCRAN